MGSGPPAGEPRRIVLCVRVPRAQGGRSVLARLRALDELATARGGVVVAFGASRIVFSFEPETFARVVPLLREATAVGEPPFAGGLAEGDLTLLAEDGSRGELAWGEALVAATALANVARSGELVCAADVSALRSGELVGTTRVRARSTAGVFRGVRVSIAKPFRERAEELSRLRVPSVVGVDIADVPIATSSLTIVRAASGAGGTRMLAELAARAPRALSLAPSGAGLAPMGSVRRAVERSITHDLGPKLVALAEPLDALLSGEPIDVETVATLICAFFAARGRTEPDAGSPLVVIDDAGSVDPASLEACARALLRADREGIPLAVVARLESGEAVPAPIASLPRGREVEVGPLSAEDAGRVAAAFTSGALDAASSVRWAERGGRLPLGIVEALTEAVATGKLVWEGARAVETSRSASRGGARDPAEWIADRTASLDPACRVVLALVALLGGEAKQARLVRILDEAGIEIDLEPTVEILVRDKWLLDVQEDWVGLPSRTHVGVLARSVARDDRIRLHAAIASVLRADEGAFGRAEAAHHAAKEGDVRRAARTAVDSARAAAVRGLEASTAQLVALARSLDPSCEEAARDALATATAKPSSGAVSRAVARGTASEKLLAAVPSGRATAEAARPPTPNLPFTPVAFPPSLAPPAGSKASEVAEHIAELAREAIRSADAKGLERAVEELQAKGAKPLLAERMRAIARIGRGEIGDALRVLRRTREALPPEEHAARCQTSLALGVTLSVGGRPAEALLEGLDALARARESNDERGTRACLAFLAKLYASVGRIEDAARLGPKA